MTEHQAMLDEFFEDPQLTVLVTGNLDPTEAYPGCVSVEFEESLEPQQYTSEQRRGGTSWG